MQAGREEEGDLGRLLSITSAETVSNWPMVLWQIICPAQSPLTLHPGCLRPLFHDHSQPPTPITGSDTSVKESKRTALWIEALHCSTKSDSQVWEAPQNSAPFHSATRINHTSSERLLGWFKFSLAR